MDFEPQLNNQIFEDEKNHLNKSLTYREKNELTAELIKKQIGDIEQIRISMGLNKKRMCELLLIDPSTWTRWSTGKTPVPPTVYRSLQWGLAVMDKHPEFHPLMISRSNLFNEARIGSQKPKNSEEIKEKSLFLEEELRQLKNTQKKLLFGIFGLISLLVIVTAFI